MPPRRRAIHPAQLAFRAAVIIGLGADFGNRARWSASQGMPFVTNLLDLAASPAFAACDPTDILCNLSAKTALESADGNWAGVPASLQPRPATCLADLTAAFNKHVWPSRSQASTRSKHWVNWAVVVTWAVAWGAAHLILPMSTDTLKGLSWELLCMTVSSRSGERVRPIVALPREDEYCPNVVQTLGGRLGPGPPGARICCGVEPRRPLPPGAG